MNSIVLSLFPLVALIASGYLFKNIVFSDEFWAGAEKLNYYILFPALLFSTLSTAKIDLKSLSTAIIAMLVVVLAVTIFYTSSEYFGTYHPHVLVCMYKVWFALIPILVWL